MTGMLGTASADATEARYGESRYTPGSKVGGTEPSGSEDPTIEPSGSEDPTIEPSGSEDPAIEPSGDACCVTAPRRADATPGIAALTRLGEPPSG
jgi:hypothetical protein